MSSADVWSLPKQLAHPSLQGAPFSAVHFLWGLNNQYGITGLGPPHYMFSAYYYLPLHPPQEFMKYQKSWQFSAAAFAVILCLKKQLSYLAVLRQSSKAWMEIEKSSDKLFNHSQLLKVQLHQCRIQMNWQQQNMLLRQDVTSSFDKAPKPKVGLPTHLLQLPHLKEYLQSQEFSSKSDSHVCSGW